MADSSGAAMESLHWPNLRFRTFFSSFPASAVTSCPVIPKSTAPESMKMGMSWARTKKTSRSRSGTFMLSFLPQSSPRLMPAFVMSSMDLSLSLPLLGMAIFTVMFSLNRSIIINYKSPRLDAPRRTSVKVYWGPGEDPGPGMSQSMPFL